ncbi:sensor domain-containing diguanylate cyclase [Aquabacterium soli]|jgi:diguanylate cyclase (GGDEF)-like protein|uniref:diguanylate cyclase n=2 Tax=Aquabacterium soli TaxID=2493092 RepID=A0A3R8T3D5_9BURK|nr:sensor domain-containing diguanylate cyclase [Aquabacterium soli]
MNEMADSLATVTPGLSGMEDALVRSLEQLGAGVLIKHLGTGRYEYASPAARGLWPGARDPLGASDAELFDAVQAVALRAADQQAVSLSSGFAAEHRLERQGERREYMVWRQALRDADGQASRVLSSWQDLTEARKREQQLQAALQQIEEQQLANAELRREMQDNQVRDNVSGLYHRAHFEEQLRREADLSSREQREFAIVSVAVDGMDDIRQTYGADSCERVVEALGRLLRANTRAMDSPCRLGGDRFVVLLSGVGLATAHSRMEHLRKQCSQHIVAYNGQQIPFTVSMGIASFPHTAGSVEELMRSADRSMAVSREKGGNHLTLASIQFVPAG